VQRFQIHSVEPAFQTQPVLNGLLGLVSRAVAMGLLRDKAIDRLDCQSIRRVFDALQHGGLLGAQRARLGVLLQPEALCTGTSKDAGVALQQVIDVLEESPVPATEWTAMRQIFGDDALADLLAISLSSLKRYASGERDTPLRIADRLHWVAMVVSDLAGSYNEFGMRRWFERERSQLDGRSPRKILGPRWQSSDESARRVRALAASLGGAGAT
jgi:hypothetical protein